MVVTPVFIQPLSQSKYETMACPRGYVAIHMEGRKTAASEASERGNEVHHIMSQYVDDCVARRLGANWPLFDTLAAATGGLAGSILDGLRDSYEVDWRRVYGTETTMMLDGAFRPTVKIDAAYWPKHVAERRFLPQPLKESAMEPAEYIGTADVILLSEDGRRAKITDFKTHPSPFDADTFQGKLYSFMLLKHLPELQQVTFELIFARYQNCTRTASWSREDMPCLQAEIARARRRQMALDADPAEALAIPGKQCTYCPLGVVSLECPIREMNPHLSISLEARLIFKEWTRRMNAENTPILKAYAEVHGNVRYADGNGQTYEYGKLDVAKTAYPLDATAIEALEMHRAATGENLLDGRLAISATKIKSLLNTKKRAALREVFEDSIVQTETRPQWAVRAADEGIVSDYNPYEEG